MEELKVIRTQEDFDSHLQYLLNIKPMIDVLMYDYFEFGKSPLTIMKDIEGEPHSFINYLVRMGYTANKCEYEIAVRQCINLKIQTLTKMFPDGPIFLNTRGGYSPLDPTREILPLN
jgi:hypothetical protein